MTVLTVGYSNHDIAAFVALLVAHRIEHLVDVRSVPRSRHNPQFNSDVMPAALQPAGITYAHKKALGGMRRPRPDSINTAWQSDSFRGYADYMQSAEFESALDDLMIEAGQRRTAIMCAEAVPWRCHRSLIGDALRARGVEVEDILTAERRQPHRITPFAAIDGTRVTYPGLGL